MRISEQNLKDVCGFVVSSHKRVLKDPAADKQQSFIQAQSSLTGLSLLLVGYREKRHVEAAAEKIKELGCGQ